MIIARQSTARIVTVGPVLDATGVAVTDGVVADFKIAKNGAAPAALNGSATLTHRSVGFYSLSLTTSDLDTVGQAEIVIDDTTNACPMREITVIEEAVYDALFAASALGYVANQPVDVNTIKTQAVTCAAGVTIRADVGAAAAPGASNGMLIGGSNAATTFAGLTTGAIAATTITASGAVAFQSTFAITTSTALGAISGSTLTLSGAVAFQSTFAVTTSTALGAISGSTLTLSGAVAFQSTFAVTTSTNLAALSCSTFAASGTVTYNAFTVTNATTLSGAVSLGSTLGVTGTTTLAALTTTGTMTVNAFTCSNVFTVTGATTLTGAVTASNASNNIVGIDVAKLSGDSTAADNAEAFFDGTGYAGTNNVIPLVTTTTNVTNVSTGGIVAASFGAGAIDAAAIGTAAIDADAIATDALGALELAAGAASEIATAVRAELGTELARIDVATSTRMATYTQPTGFLAASFPTDPADQSLIIDATNALATLIGDVPTNAELATALGTADDATLAAIAALNNLTAAQVWASGTRTLTATGLDLVLVAGKTLPDAIQIIGSVVSGVNTGAGTGTEVFKDFAGNTKATATVDSSGNRSVWVYA